MRLHRLVLANYRGITKHEIDFPDRGVVVISGANEIGKSSMIEALDLLLEAKDRSTKKDVKQVKPTHADVGAEITAEISTGPYRFEYHKRFHRRPETRLTVLAPRREQLTGDEAHDRVLAMLGETVDMDLWRAQRVLQAGSTAPVDLSGCDALSRALDAAAGATEEGEVISGAEPLLVDRIDAEFQLYFTATGRPTGQWAAAIKRLHDARAEAERRTAAVAEVEKAVCRHADLTGQLSRLGAEHEQAVRRLTAARTAADAVDALTRQLAEAEHVSVAAAATHTAALAALNARRRLRADIDERATAIAGLQTAAAAAVEDEAVAREVTEAAEESAHQARAVAEVARAQVETARLAAQRLTDRDEADQLTARLAKIDAAAAELHRVEAALAAATVTDAALREIEAAAVAVDKAAGLVEAASAHIELIAATEVEVRVGGRPVPLSAGETWTVSAAAGTDIEIPAVLTARVVPGAPAADTQAELDAARQELAEALGAVRVDDVAVARAENQRHRELSGRRNELRAAVQAYTGDDTVETLRARLTALLDRMTAGAESTESVDPAGARAALDAAVTAHERALTDCETLRKVETEAARRLADQSTRASVLREQVTAAERELASARERLTEQRSAIGDDALAVKAEADGEDARRAAARVEQLRADLGDAAPDRVAAELDVARRLADEVGTRREQTANALREVTGQLSVYGTEGRQGALDAAEAEREHAEADHLRVGSRARAVQVLRETMTRHRDATRLRYVSPFRAEVERLGRMVFGDSFQVEIDTDLCIRSRTLAGRTVDYESLSGGAKEQLGIVARLAGAALVAKEDSVPVVIDDALGFTDPDRLAKMGEVFDAVGGDGQVIVLTCSPQRYAAVDDAHRIELSA